MKKLVLMRHGHSPLDGATDFERRLDEEGRAAVRAVAEMLKRAGCRPDLMLASAAHRTAETASILIEVLDIDERRSLDELYLAGAERVLEHLERESSAREAELARGVDTIIVVGHNPGLSNLASELSDEAVGLAPADVIELDFEVEDWALLASGPSPAVRYHRARLHGGR